jgi:RNA polymerase sigma-70 factor (ECF subfamily)
VEHFRARIFHYSLMMCGHREDAEEVAQEALLKVFENFARLREPERVRAWVFRIARNACTMKRRRSVFAPSHEIPADDTITDGSAPPDRQYLQGERNNALYRAIREVPASYRSVILLRDVEELSTQETAVILDVSEDVVKTRLHRARLALRRKLKEIYN